MNHKQLTLRFIEQSAEQLQLTYPSCLHCIQTLNILDHYHHASITKITKSPPKSKILALALLSLYSKMHEVKTVQVRELAALLHFKYKSLEVGKSEGQDSTAEDKDLREVSLVEVEEEVKEWEVRVMVLLEWKLAVPLLYDQVLALATQWDQHTSFLPDFPLKFESLGPSCKSRQNYNFLVSKLRICIYNFGHLVGKVELRGLSQRVRKLSTALFIVLMKKLIREKLRLKKYILSPKVSLMKMLEEFLINACSRKIDYFLPEMQLIECILTNYQRFREQSQGKKEKTQQEMKTRKKVVIRSHKPSQEKENIPYFIHRKAKGSEGTAQGMKSRSRSRKEKPFQSTLNTCDGVRECRRSVDWRERGDAFRTNQKKKSNSTKSILSKQLMSRKEKGSEVGDKKGKKIFHPNKSKISKRSEKSQIHSKNQVGGLTAEEDFISKSTYWLRSTTLAKTDKKPTRIKIR